ncbi:MAG: N-acetyltransferase [Rhodospirillaceae bacterium]
MLGTLSWELLDFESAVAGVPFGKLSCQFEAPGPELLAAAVDQWRDDGIWLVSCRIPEDWEQPKSALMAAGFYPVETLVTFQQARRPGDPSGTLIELGGPGDVDDCADLAIDAFTYDRLHRDENVPDAIADAVRREWVKNDLSGRAAAPLIARADSRIAGFNFCLARGSVAVIDLIAVAPGFQRRGIARGLIEAAFAHFGDAIDGIQVGTQADNVASVKLYQAAGFQELRRETTLHWVNPDPAARRIAEAV